MIDASQKIQKNARNLSKVFWIYYFILIPKNTGKYKISVLINFKNKINIKNSVYAVKLDL